MRQTLILASVLILLGSVDGEELAKDLEATQTNTSTTATATTTNPANASTEVSVREKRQIGTGCAGCSSCSNCRRCRNPGPCGCQPCDNGAPQPCVNCGLARGQNKCCACCMPSCRPSCVSRGGCNACNRLDYNDYGGGYGRGYYGSGNNYRSSYNGYMSGYGYQGMNNNGFPMYDLMIRSSVLLLSFLAVGAYGACNCPSDSVAPSERSFYYFLGPVDENQNPCVPEGGSCTLTMQRQMAECMRFNYSVSTMVQSAFMMVTPHQFTALYKPAPLDPQTSTYLKDYYSSHDYITVKFTPAAASPYSDIILVMYANPDRPTSPGPASKTGKSYHGKD